MKRIFVLLIAALLLITSACGADNTAPAPGGEDVSGVQAEKNGSVVIMFTGDVHCGIDQGFGYAGVQQVRDSYENKGYTTLLVDCGDAIQGETIGTLTKGEAIIELMNKMKYDAAVPGNHEFDYGADYFLELAGKADFPYICCNISKNGNAVFDPYIIKDVCGMKIAFVGITTPETMTHSTPAYFQNENGEFIYDFKQDSTGKKLYEAVQSAVDSARAGGADYVYALGHVGMAQSYDMNYADIVGNTSGIDVFLDGHGHDSENVVLKNKNGEDVVRVAAGTKLNCIGYSVISAENGIEETDVLAWNNSACAADLFGIDNETAKLVEKKLNDVGAQLGKTVAKTAYTLTVNDPEKKDSDGNPVRIVRNAETNLGDFCADAILSLTGADIAVINAGGIRADITKGDITYNDILTVFPFNNQICVIEATGQQILDALEWGAQSAPDEAGAFLQVAGLKYEIDLSVPSGCKRDENNMQSGISGERRVRNVTVAGEPIDPEKVYTVGGIEYVLLNNGDGGTSFDGATVVNDQIKLDSQMLIDYIVQDLGGEIGEEYSDPYGQGRIIITGE